MDAKPVQFLPAKEFQSAARLRAEMSLEYGEDWDAVYPGWRERFAEFFSQKKNNGLAEIYYAAVDGKIIGMVAVSIVDHYHGYVRGRQLSRINAVFVDAKFRRQGIARRLMEKAIEWSEAKGCKRIRLNSSVIAQRLYESLDFKPIREMERIL